MDGLSRYPRANNLDLVQLLRSNGARINGQVNQIRPLAHFKASSFMLGEQLI
jgi:hypothetical protein